MFKSEYINITQKNRIFEERSKIANAIYENADFGLLVEASDGWTSEPESHEFTFMRKVVFIKNENHDLPSLRAVLTVVFPENSSKVSEAYAFITDTGNILFEMNSEECAAISYDNENPSL